jgi:hypothetical protein
MLPVTAAVATTLTCLACAREERPYALVFGTLTAVLPVAAELAGLVPRSTIFETGRVVLISRFADVDPTWALIGLVWTSAAFAPLAGYVAGRMRDMLTEAERRLFAHAWHLRQIAPEASEDGR